MDGDVAGVSAPVEIRGSTAVVTGAAGGIGAAVARRLLADGADVVAVDVNEAGLEPLREQGAGVIVADLADPASRTEVIERCTGCDFLVNAAGILFVEPLMTVGLDEWRRIWSVNVDSMFFLSQGLGAAMPSGGAIVNLSSTSAKLATSVDLAPYSFTKLAALGITRSFAYQLAPRMVRVNAICPGVIDTPMQDQVLSGVASLRGTTVHELSAERLRSVPLGRAGTPEECANLVRFLLGPESAYMTGQAINISGGLVTW